MADINDYTKDVTIWDENRTYSATVNASGRLLVSGETTTPQGYTDASFGAVVTPTKNGGTTDTTFTMTNGETYLLSKFEFGSEATLGKFELYYDPDGDMGVNAVQLLVGYINVANYHFDIGNEYTGDGTARLVLRATNNTSTNGLEFFNHLTLFQEV